MGLEGGLPRAASAEPLQRAVAGGNWLFRSAEKD